MSSPWRHPDPHRSAKRTLYVVAGFYVVVGFVIASASAVAADRVGTFLGFLIVSGAIAVGVLLRAVLQLQETAAALCHAVDELRKQVEHGVRATNALGERLGPTASSSDGMSVLDLAAIGPGDPSVLTAATLDRGVFPRLVHTMDDDPPAESNAAPAIGPWRVHGAPPNDEDASKATEPVPQPAVVPHGNGQVPESRADGGPSTKNLLEEWRVAVRHGDLAACRSIHSALIDVAGAEAVHPLTAQIEDLADRVECSLREAFAAHVRSRDFATAIAVGERICHLLPDRRVAAEFQELLPHLQRRVAPVNAPPSIVGAT